jgi:hypothetical protein
VNGPSDLLAYIDGPILILDLDTSNLDTLCGGAAEQATRAWGAKFADPRRPAPTCAAGSPPEIVCLQYAADVLIVHFDATNAPHITSAIVASQPHPSFSAVSQLRAHLQYANCP